MARPLKNGLSYYQHDVDMSADEKLEALEAVHGNDGYAVYNKLLERIYKSNGKLDLADDVQRLSIAKKCNVSAEKFEQIIGDAVRFRLFEADPWVTEKRLTSKRIRAQLATVETERERWRSKAPGENPPDDELSKEKTPVIQGENPRYPRGKVHKAEQSRAEENKSSSCARGELSPGEETEAYAAWCLDQARKSGARNLKAYAAKIAADPERLEQFQEERAAEAKKPKPIPSPPRCTCGGELKQLGSEPWLAVCGSCKDGWTYAEARGWAPEVEVLKPPIDDFEKTG